MNQIIRDVNEIYDLLPEWRDRTFAFDIETSGLDYMHDRILGLALHFGGNESYYIVLEHTAEMWDGSVRLANYIRLAEFSFALSGLFNQRNVVMVAHNSKFDMHFLRRAGLAIEGRLFDTLLAAQLLDENRSNGLKDLAPLVGITYDKYQNLHKYKGYKKTEILGVPMVEAAQYAMYDVQATYRLYEKFRQELPREKWRNRSLEDVFNKTWMPLLVVLQEMEAKGIALDLEAVGNLKAKYETIIATHERNVRAVGLKHLLERYKPEDIPPLYMEMATEEQLAHAFTADDGSMSVEVDGVVVPIITHDMVGKTKAYRPRIVKFDTSSSKQIYDLVFEWSGMEIPSAFPLKKTTQGFYSVDKDNLETLIYYSRDLAPPWLREVLEWRKASKFVGTYLNRFLKNADPFDNNCIRTSFNQAVSDQGRGGTATGRLSSSGPNLQNIPSRGDVGKEARALFVARPGMVLLVGDYSQMELRMLAHYSGDVELIDAFDNNLDLHIKTGAAFAQITYEELLEKYMNDDPWAKLQRQLGKTGNFALTYGMGAPKFQRYLLVNNHFEISVDECQAWIDNYNELYKMSTEWKNDVQKFVRQHQFVATLASRRRRLPEARSSERWRRSRAERQGVNAIIQGSCGDFICQVMPEVHQELAPLGGYLLLQVHDELVAEVPEEKAELGREIMQMFMNVDHWGLRVPMIAEVNVGKTWADAKG